MNQKTLKALLGDKQHLIREIGPEALLLYLYMSQLETEECDDWEWRSHAYEGIPIIASFDLSDVSDLGVTDLNSLLISLRSGRWIYDFDLEGDFAVVVMGTFDRVEIPAIAELVSDRTPTQVQPIAAAHLPARPGRRSERMSRAQSAIDAQKERTEERRKINSEKRSARRKKKGDLGWATIGAEPHLKAAKKAANPYPMNKPGLYRLYSDLYFEMFKVDAPNIFRNGRPGKGAGQLNHIVDDYGIEVAHEYVALAMNRWDEISQILGSTTQPVPAMLASLRHDICVFVQQRVSDPVDSFRKRRQEVRPNFSEKKREDHRQSINDDEWRDDEDEKDVGW